jgi:hypothetical protein
VMHAGTTLTDAMRQWNGPQAQTETGLQSQNTAGRRLNPAFVEWLMGFLPFWSLPCDTASTDCDASEMP